MVRFNGIRAQLFLAFGALVLVINLFYARLNYLFVEATEDIVASLLIEQEMLHLQQGWMQTGTLTPTAGHFSVYPENRVVELGEQQPVVNDFSLFTVEDDGSRNYLVPLTFTEEPVQYLLFQPAKLTRLAGFANMFGVFLFSLSAGAMVLAVLSTWFLAGKLSQPLRALTQSVARQKPDKDCEIEGTGRPDEIGQLASAFDSTYGELQRAWRRERDFANDVSHELRTPIALIRNTLTLNTSSQYSAQEQQLVEQATNSLHQTVEVLLALARRENLQFAPCKLRPFIERATLAVLKAHPEALFQVEVEVDDNVTVTGNGNLISLLCQNLINNGFYHGDGSSMRIHCEDGCVIFENAIADQQHSTTYQGLGHGLYLINRIATTMGWQIVLEPANEMYRVCVRPV